jgi:hypothetical protein
MIKRGSLFFWVSPFLPFSIAMSWRRWCHFDDGSMTIQFTLNQAFKALILRNPGIEG